MIWLLSSLDIQIQDANKLNTYNLPNDFWFWIWIFNLILFLFKISHVTAFEWTFIFSVIFICHSWRREIKPPFLFFVSQKIEKKKKKNSFSKTPWALQLVFLIEKLCKILYYPYSTFSCWLIASGNFFFNGCVMIHILIMKFSFTQKLLYVHEMAVLCLLKIK